MGLFNTRETKPISCDNSRLSCALVDRVGLSRLRRGEMKSQNRRRPSSMKKSHIARLLYMTLYHVSYLCDGLK